MYQKNQTAIISASPIGALKLQSMLTGLALVTVVAGLTFLAGPVRAEAAIRQVAEIPVELAEEADWPIQNFKATVEDGIILIKGRVRPGNRRHVPKLFGGHIDLFIKQAGQEDRLVEVIRLRSRQQYFSKQVNTVLPEGARLVVSYSEK